MLGQQQNKNMKLLFPLFISLFTFFIFSNSVISQSNDNLLFRPVKELPEEIKQEYNLIKNSYTHFKKERFVKINLRTIKNVTGAEQSDSQLLLNPFKGVRIPVSSKNLVKDDDNFYTLVDTLDAQFYGKVILTISKEYIMGLIHLDYKIYELIPLADGFIWIIEVDQQGFTEEYCGPLEITSGIPPSPPPNTGSSNNTIRLMVLFESAGLAYAVQRKKCIEKTYKNLLDEAFNSFNYTGTKFEVIVDFAPQYNLVGDSFHVDIDWLEYDAFVQTKRDAIKADLVTLIAFKGSLGGLGNNPYPPSSSTDHKSNSVVKIDGALSGYSLPHEIGHNFGMWHNRKEHNGGHPAFCNYGYINCWKNDQIPLYYRTIMSYDSGCSQHLVKVGGFSTPIDLSNNFSTLKYGIECSPNLTGKNGAAYNSLNIFNYAYIISNYR